VKRFSTWNEPNHPGFLRAGAYWKTKDAKARVNTVLELKALQHVFENAKVADPNSDADDPVKVAAAVAQAKKFRYLDDLKKLPTAKNKLPAYPPTNRKDWAKLCDELANRKFAMPISRADNKQIARAERDKPGTRYNLFNLKANAKVYRAIHDACWKRTKGKGVKIWLGELSSGSAFAFLDYLVSPKITGTRRVLKADALALHPYQYLIPPTKKPDARPVFVPKMKVDPAAPPDQQKAAKAWNKARRVAMAKKWPTNPKKRKEVREKARSNAGMGAVSVVQRMLTGFAKKPKRMTGRDGKKLDLYLTEFGYHRVRPQKMQFDRQVPEPRRARWVKLAYDVAYRNGVKQNLYYHLLASWELHEWDSALLDNANAQTPTFDALADWVAKGKLKNKVKTTVD
jgi:hypothetical protein